MAAVGRGWIFLELSTDVKAGPIGSCAKDMLFMSSTALAMAARHSIQMRWVRWAHFPQARFSKSGSAAPRNSQIAIRRHTCTISGQDQASSVINTLTTFCPVRALYNLIVSERTEILRP